MMLDDLNKVWDDTAAAFIWRYSLTHSLTQLAHVLICSCRYRCEKQLRKHCDEMMIAAECGHVDILREMFSHQPVSRNLNQRCNVMMMMTKIITSLRNVFRNPHYLLAIIDALRRMQERRCSNSVHISDLNRKKVMMGYIVLE